MHSFMYFVDEVVNFDIQNLVLQLHLKFTAHKSTYILNIVVYSLHSFVGLLLISINMSK